MRGLLPVAMILLTGITHDPNIAGVGRIAGITKEIAPMNPLVLLSGGLALAGVVVCGVAFAEAPASSPTPIPAPAPMSSKPSTATTVETWTKKQWNAAQKEWAKDKAKWADCRKQSKAQKLSGQKSWSFLYQCMTG